jgi:4-alpha-glucanotransferase
VLQFAFDPREESDYLPHNYDKNCVVYTGTHDNDTVNGWVNALGQQDLDFTKEYLNVRDRNDICQSLIRTALGSVADTAIIPIQDYLGLGSEARINTPSTLGGNWQWRIEKGACNDGLSRYMLGLAKTYARIPKPKKAN